MIEVKNLQQTFGRTTVLQNIDFSIKKGEIVGLLGPSGSGKTTLIKTLIGMLKPSKGEVFVLGTKQPSLKPMKDIGYMAQSDALYEELSAKANLAYFGRLYGLHGKRLKKQIHACLSFVDLDKEAKKPVRKYSGGMKRRLSLAISLIHQPQLIFLDEPTVGVDPTLKRTFWDEFDHLRNQGISFIISTHVMDEADRCDRILLINHSNLLDAGTPDKIKETYGSIEEAFLKAGDAACKS